MKRKTIILAVVAAAAMALTKTSRENPRLQSWDERRQVK